jgi:molybdopterin synthase sulfur carrier subunit
MSIQVKLFASLRERLERDTFEIEADGIATVADVWARIAPHEPLTGHLLMAVNMDYAQPDSPVADGDEVGFFPPVTGGVG